MAKPFKFGFIVGRFNHIHKGHESLINKGRELCENLLILVGSSQESGTLRNPFAVEERMRLIKQVYGENVYVGFLPDTTNENDITHDWGRYVLDQVGLWGAVHNIQYPPDVMIYGNDEDRAGWYAPEDIWNITQVVVPREAIDISATKMRKLLIENKRSEWERYTPRNISMQFTDLRYLLLRIPEYKEMADNAGTGSL